MTTSAFNDMRKLVEKNLNPILPKPLGQNQKELLIVGTTYYALQYDNDYFCDFVDDLTYNNDIDWDRLTVLEKDFLIICAAYIHFAADMEWANDHFDERMGYDDETNTQSILNLFNQHRNKILKH